MTDEKPQKSPDPKIDRALKAMFKNLKNEPLETQVKVVAQAIAWAKVKAHIQDRDDDFDPNKL